MYRPSRGLGSRQIARRNFGNTVRSGELRVAYDPATGTAKVWLDAKDLGQYNIPNPPRSGKFILLSSSSSCKISWIRVLPGVVSPGDDKAIGGADADTAHVVEFGESDRMQTKSLRMVGGNFEAETSAGPLACSTDALRKITFSKTSRETQRRLKGDVRIQADRSKLTLQLQSLDEQYVVGKSDSLGVVKIRRNAVKAIRFNIYSK